MDIVQNKPNSSSRHLVLNAKHIEKIKEKFSGPIVHNNKKIQLYCHVRGEGVIYNNGFYI
jgi:hypothetical protein